MKPVPSLALLLPLSAIVAGCISLQRDPPQTVRYVLDVRRDGAVDDRAGPRLQIRTFHAASAYSGVKLVYRTGETTIEPDFYNEFLVPPAIAITELARDWLDSSGRFGTVRGAGGPTPADWILDGDVLAIFGDERDGQAAAVLELHVIVVSAGDSKIVLERTYRRRESIGDSAAPELVRGLTRALASILDELERDLGNAG